MLVSSLGRAAFKVERGPAVQDAEARRLTVGLARSIRTAQEATTSRSTKARILVPADA